MKEEQLYNTERLHAINVVQDFFDFYGLPGALDYTEKLMYYSVHSKYFKERSPHNLVFFSECLRKVLPACFVLERAYLPEKLYLVQAGEKGLPDLTRTFEYMPIHTASHWHYLPRHLAIEQYLNPMLALKKLRKYRTQDQWMKVMDDLVEYALSNATIHGCLPPHNILKIRKILLQVIEGCYLLKIRHENYYRTLKTAEKTQV